MNLSAVQHKLNAIADGLADLMANLLASGATPDIEQDLVELPRWGWSNTKARPSGRCAYPCAYPCAYSCAHPGEAGQSVVIRGPDPAAGCWLEVVPHRV
jgi:hypothetical protein